MHIMPVELLGRAGNATYQRARQHWGQMHRLIQQAVEQQSLGSGLAIINRPFSVRLLRNIAC